MVGPLCPAIDGELLAAVAVAVVLASPLSLARLNDVGIAQAGSFSSRAALPDFLDLRYLPRFGAVEVGAAPDALRFAGPRNGSPQRSQLQKGRRPR